ncbi:MAG TPA: hypothetical protein VIX19_11585 [Terriglobales bacterium]
MYGELDLIKTTQGGEVAAIPIVIANPPKAAALRLPTAEEIAAYTASIRQLIRRIGRRQTEEQDVPNHEAERKLFEAIRLDRTGEEFDEAEMRHAIDIAMRHNVASCERSGDQYVVKVVTLWGVTLHTCRVPKTAELQTYRDHVIKSRELPHNVEERRFPPEVPARFYDAIILSVEGYAPNFNVAVGTVNGNRHAFEGAELKAILPQIPPHHKRSVAGEVSGALYDLDPQLDPNA